MNASKANNRQKNQRRYSKKSKNANKNNNTVPIESLDRFAGSSEEDNDNDNNEVEEDVEEQNIDQKSNTNNNTGAGRNLSEMKSSDDTLKKGMHSSSKTQSVDSDADVDDSGDDDSDNNNDESDDDDDEKYNDRIEEEADDNIDDEYNDDNDDTAVTPQFHITTGIASAMNRILNAPIQTSKKVTSTPAVGVVLSKTKTPLQLQAEKEKKLQEALKESRRVKRERQTKALHIPLTVATNSFVVMDGNNKSAISMELETERMHRRVATRGIVALFNAIAQHQVHPDQTAEQAAAAAAATSIDQTSSSKVNAAAAVNSASKTKLTKHGFLDLIKQKAISAAATTTSINKDTKQNQTTGMKDVHEKGSKISASSNNNNHTTSTTKKWNALKDDYMLDSTKNWDELEDEDNNDEDHFDDDDDTFQNHGKHEPSKKKIRSR